MPEKPTYEELEKRIQELEAAEAEQKELRNALRQSESRLNQAQRIAKIGSWDMNIETGDGFWSDELFRLLGYQPGEKTASYSLFREHVDPDDVHQFEENLIEYTSRVKHVDEIFRFHTTSGETRFAHSTGTIEFNAAGNPLRAYGTFQDITEFKKAQDALQRQLHFERGISAASTCLLTTRDQDRNVTESLGCLCEAAGVSRVYLFQNFHDDADGLCMHQTHEACAAGIVPQIDNPELQHVVYADGFERWRQELAAGRYISGHVADFPEGEREILESQNIVSILVLPVLVDGAWNGFIGFDETRQRREWLKEEVLLLKTAAEFLAVI